MTGSSSLPNGSQTVLPAGRENGPCSPGPNVPSGVVTPSQSAA
ncbi:MAG: hypothetical protein R3F59_28515 [Myxococcota bacterium]